MIMTVSTFVIGFVIAFITGWLMALVLVATLPALGLSGYLYIRIVGEKDKV